MPHLSIFLLIGSFGLLGAVAKPVPQGTFGVNACSDGESLGYKKTGEKTVAGKAVVGSQSCKGTDGCQLLQQSTYSVGVSVEVGADLGLDFGEIVSLGLSASVSQTTEGGSAQGAQVECPEGEWTCSIAITPTVLEVTGTKEVVDGSANMASCDTKEEEYVVQFPKKGADGTVIAATEICACKNKEHWADNGAPKPCPADCPS